MIEECNTSSIQELIKPCSYIPIGLYYNDVLTSNVYIGEDISKNKCFMIKIAVNKLSVLLIDNLNKINQLNCPSVLAFISLSKIGEDYYLVYEYSDGIQLDDYIIKAIPKGKKRLMFLMGFVSFLDSMNKNQMIIGNDPLFDFIFVENFESNSIKVLYSNGLISHKTNKKEDDDNTETIDNNIQTIEEYNQLDYFHWLSKFIYSLSKYGLKKDDDDFNKFFSEFNNEMKEKLKNLFAKVFIRYKEGNSNAYSIDLFVSEFKLLCDELGLIIQFNSNNSINTNNNNNTSQNEEKSKEVAQLVKKPLMKMPSFTLLPSNGFNINVKVNKETNASKGNKDCESQSQQSKAKAINNSKPNPKLNDKASPCTNKNNIIIIPLQDEESTKGKAAAASSSQEIHHNEQQPNLGKAFLLFNDNKTLNDTLNTKTAPTQSQIYPNLLMSQPMLNQSASPFQNYSLWFNQTLNRMNALNQILTTQILDVNSQWHNIQMSHYHFLNQFPNKTPNNHK